MFRPLAFRPSLRRRALPAAALLLCTAPLGAALAARSSAEEAQVYTDEDLKSLHRPAPPPEEPAPAAPQARPQTHPQTQPGPRPGGQTPMAPGPGPQTRPAAQSQPVLRTRPAAPAQPGATSAPQSRAASPGAGSASSPDDGAWAHDWKHDEKRRQYWQNRVRAAEDRASQIEQLLEYLGRKKASIANPYLARPALSAEDAQAEMGMDGAARLARVEDQIARARQDLEVARQAVEAARAEMAAALAPPDLTGWSDTNH